MNDIMTLVQGKFLNYVLSVLSDSQWSYNHINHFIEICQKIFKIQKVHYNHALNKNVHKIVFSNNQICILSQVC